MNLENKRGQTALMRASYRGHTEVVKLLLERPEIDVNVQNSRGDTALMWASWNDHTEIVNLIKAHPNYNSNA